MQIVLAHVYKKRALNDNVGPYEARVKKVINFIIYIISHYKGSSICDMIGGMEQEIFFWNSCLSASWMWNILECENLK